MHNEATHIEIPRMLHMQEILIEQGKACSPI